MEYLCKCCGVVFFSSKKNRVYCSISCSNKKNKTLIEKRKCGACNNEFNTFPASSKKHCSKSCGNKSDKRKTGFIRNCKYCNSEFYSNRYNNSFFCKKKCVDEFNRCKEKDFKTKRIKNSSWIKKVKERDKCECKVCGGNENISVHHIIPYRAYPEIYDLNMNGVCLCKKCHNKYDALNREEFGTTGKYIKKIDNPNCCFMATIPHELHRYPTCGDYEWTRNGTLIIFVSDMKNDKYHKLIFMHEFIEAMLCKSRGINEKDITQFDIYYEKRRSMGFVVEDSEPGDDINAPYNKEHIFATKLELMFAAELNVDWNDYSLKVNSL